MQKKGELFHTVLKIPEIIALIAKIHCKMVPINILISALCKVDRIKIRL